MKRSLSGFLLISTLVIHQPLTAAEPESETLWSTEEEAVQPQPEEKKGWRSLSKKEKAAIVIAAMAALAGSGVLLYRKAKKREGPSPEPTPPQKLFAHGEKLSGADDVFKSVMGIDEADFHKKLKDAFRKVAQGTDDLNMLDDWWGKKPYMFTQWIDAPPIVKQGIYKRLTIPRLRFLTGEESMGGEDKPPFVGNPQFTVITGHDHPRNMVQYMEGLPENNGALFQVASTRTTIEGSAQYGSNASGALAMTSPQGQAAVSPTPGGVIQRTYYLKKEDLWAPVKRRGKIGIGLHKNLQVTATYDPDTRSWHYLDPQVRDQRINHALVFALNLSGKEKTDELKTKALVYLNAAYELTLRAAVYAGTQKVFLTLLGDGVFANPREWILQAIENQKDLIKKFNLHVTLTHYGRPKQKFTQWAEKMREDIEGD